MTSRALLTAILFGSAIAGTRPMTHAANAQPRQPERQRADEAAPGLCVEPTRAATPPLCQN